MADESSEEEGFGLKKVCNNSVEFHHLRRRQCRTGVLILVLLSLARSSLLRALITSEENRAAAEAVTATATETETALQ
ncbi:hypothetical protein H5410_039201 [Solanum commersonii]|uniref:Uncharacterized protein n=1 Tax=Solanum commersonii TaxID=4109 RepID=A0A9J5YCD2_SOLCO|nr:hypothetical protein H5410_039201 [Solanum commersonii]